MEQLHYCTQYIQIPTKQKSYLLHCTKMWCLALKHCVCTWPNFPSCAAFQDEQNLFIVWSGVIGILLWYWRKERGRKREGGRSIELLTTVHYVLCTDSYCTVHFPRPSFPVAFSPWYQNAVHKQVLFNSCCSYCC